MNPLPEQITVTVTPEHLDKYIEELLAEKKDPSKTVLCTCNCPVAQALKEAYPKEFSLMGYEIAVFDFSEEGVKPTEFKCMEAEKITNSSTTSDVDRLNHAVRPLLPITLTFTKHT